MRRSLLDQTRHTGTDQACDDAAVNAEEERGVGRTVDGERILQLVPAAPGWWVRYRFEDPADWWTAPIACWALVEIGGQQYIRGVNPTTDDWHEHGTPLHQDVLYFYSAEVPENALGTSEPPLPKR
jgi:hypothetical protein